MTENLKTTATLELPFAPPGLWIDGARRKSTSGAQIESRNPATGDLLTKIERGNAEDVDIAVQAALRAQVAWRALAPGERARRLVKLGELVTAHAEELAMMDVLDNGSPIKEMRIDLERAARYLRYFAGLATEVRGQTIPSEHSRLDYTLRQPYGVVGRIVPFNHPLMFAAKTIGAPLVTGNTVVLKPSELTSISAVRLAEIASEVLPPGVLNVVTGLGHEVGDALVRHHEVRRIAFTGSAPTGRRILESAATVAIKHISLELGGKNPIVVFPDADLELAVEGAVRGMNFSRQGQSCGSTSRLIVHESIHDDFVEQLGRRLTDMPMGLPQLESTESGAIVSEGQYHKALEAISWAVEDGARIVAGGERPTDPELANGFFVRPTLLAGVTPESRLAQTEVFGPVLAALRFSSYEEAIEIANGVEYGLTAAVFTRDLAIAHAFARDVEAGYVWVNDSSRHFPGAPFGGVKESGLGSEEGQEELISYTQLKNVNVRFGA